MNKFISNILLALVVSGLVFAAGCKKQEEAADAAAPAADAAAPAAE